MLRKPAREEQQRATCPIPDKKAVLSGISPIDSLREDHGLGKVDQRPAGSKDTDPLARALVSLIREKPYDEMVVKEILDRANVGRSTFYTHYRNKDGRSFTNSSKRFSLI